MPSGTYKKTEEHIKKLKTFGFQKGQKAWNLGKKLSKKHKEKIIVARKGSKHSIKTKEKQSLAHRGEKSYNWKGGITSLYLLIRNSFIYRQWRSDVFTRDNFICQECGQIGRKLNADHIKPFSVIIKQHNIKTLEDAINCSELWNINNGRTLCVLCHRKTNTWGEKVKQYEK